MTPERLALLEQLTDPDVAGSISRYVVAQAAADALAEIEQLRDGPTAIPPAKFRLGLLDALTAKGLPVEDRRLVDDTLIELWREFFAHKPEAN